MDNKASISYCFGSDRQTTIVVEDLRLSEGRIGNTKPFVNHAFIAWVEKRKEWIGEQSKKSAKTKAKVPIEMFCNSYDGLDSLNHQAIPLSEVVAFLVGTWREEGLF